MDYDYAAFFFNKILEVLGSTERSVAGVITIKMRKKQTNLLNLCKQQIDSCHEQCAPDVHESYYDNIIIDLQEIYKLEGIKQLDNLTLLLDRMRGINQISNDHYEQVSSLIAKISSAQFKTGYADSTIHIYKKKLPVGKIQGLYDYFLHGEHFNSDIISILIHYLNSNEFHDIPSQTINRLTMLLKRTSETDNSPIYEVLLHLSHLTQQRKKKTTPPKSIESFFTDESETGTICKKIMSLIDANWADISPEILGITQLEFDQIKRTPLDHLMDDYFLHQTVLPDGIDVFKSDSFNAIVKYRLYNVLYTWNSGLEDESIKQYEEEKNDPYEYPAVMKVAVALLGKALEGTTIFIHPAARISSPIYIGHHTMIGKQCTIGHDSILGNNVCLYPFNTINKKHLDEYIVFGNNTIVFSNTRVLGTISFGNQCVLTSSLITGSSFGNNVVDKCGIENGRKFLLNDDSIKQYRNNLIEDIREDSLTLYGY